MDFTPKQEGWWLKMAAPPGTSHYDQADNRSTRERLRHAKLTAYLFPFVFIAPLFFVAQASDPGTRVAIIVTMCVAVCGLVLNRTGHQVFAAILLVLVLDASIEVSLATSGVLSTGWLLTFDLFLFPLCVAGVLLHRRYLVFFGALHIALILGDYFLLPHSNDLTAMISYWGSPTVVFIRPVILEIAIAIIMWLSIGSTDEAIVRADQAEFVAQLQATIASEKEELEEGIQHLVTTLSQAANGNYVPSTRLTQHSALWRIDNALSILFTRLQSSREREAQAQALIRDIQNLNLLLQKARSGEPVRWPMPNGSVLDPLIQEFRRFDFSQGRRSIK